ncbi:histidine kinase dimerization/phospho-acceptor domain-containing protein, partial [Acinetobacter baumannii]
MLQIFYFSFIVILIIIAILIYNAKKSIQYEQDILQAKNKAEKLAQTKARFLSNMSHEIRSPLTAIIGFTEQLEKNETDTSKLKQLNAIHS